MSSAVAEDLFCQKLPITDVVGELPYLIGKGIGHLGIEEGRVHEIGCAIEISLVRRFRAPEVVEEPVQTGVAHEPAVAIGGD
ncbi:MAG: hypothetical protein V3S38_02735 [Acidimicrobiia bacterium]